MENFHQRGKELPIRIGILIKKFMQDTITASEHVELDEWIEESDANMKLFEDLSDPSTNTSSKPFTDKKRVRAMTAWLAAIVVLLLTGFFIYHFAFRSTSGMAMEILPGNGSASLLIPGHKNIELGKLSPAIPDSNMEMKSDSELVYKKGRSIHTAETHTLVTPIGCQFSVTLSDGSRILLNAASRITYPAFFNDSIREIRLEGEAYFEIAKDAMRPFKVWFGDAASAEVTGTHFNINNYSDEPYTTITLTEGQLRVMHLTDKVELSAGEQVQFSKQGLVKLTDVDTTVFTDWTRGIFYFKNIPISAAVRQLERWYPVKFTIDKGADKDIVQKYSKRSSLATLLKNRGVIDAIRLQPEKKVIRIISR